MRKLLLAILLCVLQFQCFAGEPEHVTLKYQGFDREYWLFVPDSLCQERPLVILLHGYGGTAEGYRLEMVRCARENGFVLCIPQGYKDPTGERGWNVGYPSQKGMKIDDVAFVRYLARTVSRRYGLDKGHIFLTGMSNGGEMCYVMACEHPGLFCAIASVAGLTMEWLVKERPVPSEPVTFMEIHGTADKVSLWEGDPGNSGGWGAYASVPAAVGRICSADRCTYETVQKLPLKSASSRQVILHRYLGGTKEVRLYEVEGGPHSWHLDDIDTVNEIWNFFKSAMKENPLEKK